MKISQIYIYPIKSLRGVSVPSATATRKGFQYDRRFMLLKVIQNDDGTSTLKNMHVPHFPEMVLFQTDILLNTDTTGGENKGIIRVSWRPAVRDENTDTQSSNSTHSERVKDEEEKTLEIPLQPDTDGLEELEVMMHSSPTKGYNMGAAHNDWFSERLGYPVVLAYLGEANWRRVLGSFPPGRSAAHREPWYRSLLQNEAGVSAGAGGGMVCLFVALLISLWDNGLSTLGASGRVLAIIGLMWVGFSTWSGNAGDDNIKKKRRRKGVVRSKEERIGFADASPYMVMSATSVANVSDRLLGPEEMDSTKFRANLVVSGAENAFEEDFWAELDLNTGDAEREVKILLTANCVRCRSLDVDYATGKMGTGESGKVLKKLMGDRRVDRGAKYNPVFGRYGFLDGGATPSEIRVGDEVAVGRRIKERTVYDWPGLA